MSIHAVRLVAAGAFLAGLTIAVPAQEPASAPNRRIEGHWVRVDTEGAGTFADLTSHFTPAMLTPEAAARGARGGGGRGGARGGAGRGAPAADAGPNPTGVPYIAVQTPCANAPGRGNGALLLSPDSGAVHFIEHKDEILFAGERGGVRHIYMDGRPRPTNWVPTPAGHSVGRYEGDVLVVETVGLTPGNVVAGGVRSPETVLEERFEVSADGRRMTITYTWTDPAIYVKPHRYQYFMERLPPGSYALEEWCDASDPLEQQSIVPPEQLQ